MDNIKIEYLPIKDLKPYERNAKKHDETQIKNVAESIKQFGFAQPIVVDRNNVVIIGHCRLLASKKLKLKEVPAIRMEDLTDEQVQKLRLLDNRLNESEWDFDLLAEDIPTLDFSDFDIDWGLPEDIEDEKPAKEPNDIDYHESISVVIDCDNDEQAEDIFTKLTSEGYTCRISTL
jgi:site-specific DNA-methyltransferase (adenine-specific)